MKRLPDQLAGRVLEALPFAIVLVRGRRAVLANQAARRMLSDSGLAARMLAVTGRARGTRRYRMRLAGPPVRHVRLHAEPLTGTGLTLIVLWTREPGSEVETDDETQAELETSREIMNSQRDFVRMLNHELRTPIAIIDQKAQRALTKAEPGTAVEDALRKIREAASSMHVLLGSSLSAERLAPESFQVTKSPQDLARLVMRASDRIAAGLEDSVHIETLVPEAPPAIGLDPAWIGQVLNNLLENAIKYSPGEPQVTVIHRLEPGWQVVEVQDQGIGLPETGDQGLFDRFTRGTNTRTIRGTGMGLHLVRLVVDQHGGTIRLSPNTPQGTIATLRLPQNNA